MGLFAIVKRLYTLDTLDTRFTTSSRTPPRDTRSRIDPAQPSSGRTSSSIGEKNNKTVVERSSDASPSRWRTPEFFVYYFTFITVVPMMFKVTYDVSKETHPNYSSYAHLLSSGWIPGRKVDNSDAQYSTFRDNIPYMFVVLALHPLLRRLYNTIYPIPESKSTAPSQSPNSRAANPTSSLVSSATADARLTQRVSFDLIFAAVFLCALHGFSALKVFLILYINFTLATRLPKAQIPIATWIFNIGILFTNEYYKGYPYDTFVKYILPGSVAAQTGSEKDIGGGWGTWLDAYGGLISRWEILFNITVLRLISFNLDYYWSLDRNGGSPIEVRRSPYGRHGLQSYKAHSHKKKQLDPANLSERERVDTPARPQDYSFRNYLAYVLYSPLYLTGPILTFNDYISQLRYTPSSIKTDRTILYAIRFLITLLTMELVLHFIYAVAISKAQPAWQVYTPFQLSMLGYFNLHIIWLKLLLPWRFFRLWALLDGVDPPENMVRCMSDNYSALAFWRGWHRSFNRWIVRYIYIPLGGSGGPGTHGYWGKARAMVNFLLVFTFVAIWHDINLKLLIWGWLITLFVLPEVLAGLLFPKRKWQSHKEAYRIICSIGAVGNILMMMAANLVGFAVGLDGLKGLVQGIVGSYHGIVFLGAACACLFIGVQIMFEVRAQELREGIRMKC